MKKQHQRWFYLKRYILFGICLCLLVAVFALCSDASLHTIVTYISNNPLLCAVLLLLFYALKSISIVFPMLALEIAAGYLFSPLVALGINLAGILIALSIPYWIGHVVGIKQINKLTAKYPKVEAILSKQQSHSFFLCFFLRVVSYLPGDVVTMYLGATHVSFWQNLLGGTLGILPGMVLATFMGSNVQDPSSPAFWISAALSVGLASLSTLLYFCYLKRQKHQEETT